MPMLLIMNVTLEERGISKTRAFTYTATVV